MLRENIDETLNLAQSAKREVPEDPHISDTLGWIYYKKKYSYPCDHLFEGGKWKGSR